MEQADFGACIKAFQESVRLSQEAGFVIAQVVGRAVPAIIYANLGDTSTALRLAQEALAIAVERLPAYRPAALMAVAQAQLRANRLSECEATLKDASESLIEADVITASILAGISCECALARGDAVRAFEAATRMKNSVDRMGLIWQLPDAQYFLSTTKKVMQDEHR